MPTEEEKALAHRFHMDIFQGGNLAVADEICAPSFVIHSPGLPPEMQYGPEGVKRYATALRTGFGNNLQMRHEDTIAEGDKVVIRWTASATHRGELFGVPPTGKQVTVTGSDIFRVAGGKLAEVWIDWDNLGLLQQIGAIPGPGQAGRQAA